MTTNHPNIQTVLVEDEQLMRQALPYMLQEFPDIQIVATADNGKKGIELIVQTNPDVAIIDLGLPDINCIEVIQSALLHKIKTRFLILTSQNNWSTAIASFQQGATSCHLKQQSGDPKIIANAIRATAKGNQWIDPKMLSLKNCQP